MEQQTKRKLKKGIKTSGKYDIKGIKFAGQDVLSDTDFTNRAIEQNTKNKNTKTLIFKTGNINPCVTFLNPTISITGISYTMDNSVLDHYVSPIESLNSTLGVTEKIVSEVLELVDDSSVPKETEKLFANEYLDR